MKIQPVTGGHRIVTITLALLRAFVQHLTTAPGFHPLAAFKAAAPEVVAALSAKRIENVMVSTNANIETMVEQLERVLGSREFTAPFLAEPALLFNLPKNFSEKGALLFTRGEVQAEARPETQYLEIEIEDVRQGLTDFGEEMLRFMELNGITSVKVYDQLFLPRYATSLGFSGAVGEGLMGKPLGAFPSVSGWTIFSIEIDPTKCSPTKDPSSSCRACVLVCPAGAVDPGRSIELVNWGSGLTEEERFNLWINPEACKGCKLCVEACGPGAISIIEGKK